MSLLTGVFTVSAFVSVPFPVFKVSFLITEVSARVGNCPAGARKGRST
jgi:hypothetical protein